jgi:hypothetical protein
MSDVAKAEHVLSGLRQKRDAVVAHGVELGDERGKISFAAHTGDKAARQKLDKLNAESALHDSELRSLDAAIAEAAARVQQARQAEAQAADRQKAAEAEKLSRELEAAFAYVDKHLAEAAKGLLAIEMGFKQLHAAGFSSPTDAMIRLNICAVIQSWAHRLPRSWHDQLRDGLEFLAPGRRQSAVEYWRAIEPSLQRAIRQQLGEPQSEAPPAKQKEVA